MPTMQLLPSMRSTPGAYWFNIDNLLSVLDKIQNNNVQGEYYLPDAVKLLIAGDDRAGAI